MKQVLILNKTGVKLRVDSNLDIRNRLLLIDSFIKLEWNIH